MGDSTGIMDDQSEGRRRWDMSMEDGLSMTDKKANGCKGDGGKAS